LTGGKGDIGACDATGETAWKEGVKLGASALSFLDAAGAVVEATDPVGLETAGATSFALFAVFVLDTEPAVEPVGIALRSDIIFCKLANASPVDSSFFCLTASAAASKAVRGTDGAVCSDFGTGADCKCSGAGGDFGSAFREAGRDVAVWTGFGRPF
jgi:hypothetical protein